ncbi:MAG: hypothetical protein GY870_11515 [archaeon]|nr:hypothetical protein [archaeon]
MVKSILITGWRNDRGAFLLDSVPKGVNIDEQDLMNLYNMHRFRDTKANFQFISASGLKIVSFYSGGYDSPYVGKPNYSIALILDPNENPNVFEKPLRILTNNILLHLDDPNFDDFFVDIFSKIQEGGINEFKIERKTESIPTPKEIVTSDSINLNISSEEEDSLFDELLATVSEDEIPDSLKFDEESFRKSIKQDSVNDPFGGNIGGNTEDSDELFKGDPFAPSKQEDIFKSSTSIKTDISSQSTKIIEDLEKINKKIPKEPSDKTPENMVAFLEQKVGYLEKKISLLSQIARQIQLKDKEIEEKNDLIAKLLVLLS